mgnify:CR=1 FL=1
MLFKRIAQPGPIVAFVAPFVLYVLPTMVESTSWSVFSYEFICTLKGVLAAMALWAFRRRYPAFSTRGFRLAVIAGTLGCVAWVILERLQSTFPIVERSMSFLIGGKRNGFDPFSDGGPSPSQLTLMIVRLSELVIIVPLGEELFWRGFLARYLIADDFENVAQGTFTRFSFAVVTLAFVSVHPEILAAFVWGILINLLYRRTANLWACIVMHSITNGLLGAYILTTESWHLW